MTVPRPQLTLASLSPRRAELLAESGFRFDVMAPCLSEPTYLPGARSPVTLALALSYWKARAVSLHVSSGVLLAADTVVALGDEVFGKPRDIDDARRILSRLSGTEHQVITGVTVLSADRSARLVDHDRTQVRMRSLAVEEIETYLAGGAWQGKAGAYGIQDHDDPFIECTEGSFSNVVGLPMGRVRKMLRRFGVEPG